VIRARTRPSSGHRRRRRRYRRRVIDYFRHRRLLPRSGRETGRGRRLVLAAYQDISGLPRAATAGVVGCTRAARLSIYI